MLWRGGGSPGRKLTLEKPELNIGCAYASDGTGVVILVEKLLSFFKNVSPPTDIVFLSNSEY